MSEVPEEHPDRRDLDNFARQELGAKKSERIVDHCKRCPPCADLLLDAVREQEISAPRPPLSRWQWLSIGLMVVALLVLIAAMVWFVRNVGEAPPFGAPSDGDATSEVGVSA